MDLDETRNQSDNLFVKIKNTTSKPGFVKKLIPRSGSYDIKNFNDSMHSLKFNDKDESDQRRMSRLYKSTQNVMKLFSEIKTDKRKDVDLYETCHEKRQSFSKFQKKWTILGMPLLYLTYFSAFYTLLAYGATSLISVFFIISNITTVLIPLYILLIGYLIITFTSFLLIIAIKKRPIECNYSLDHNCFGFHLT